MKKIIVAILSVILGSFGYTVVDQAVEDRVADLEAKVSIQQSVIDEFSIADGDARLAADMPVGSTMLCIPSEPTVYTLENGTEVYIEKFTNTVVEHRELGELGAVGYSDDLQYAQSLFQIEIRGKIDPSYAGKYIGFSIGSNTEGYRIEDVINSDGTFCVKQRPMGFVQEFVCEIREIQIGDKEFITGTFASTDKPEIETITKPTTTQKTTTRPVTTVIKTTTTERTTLPINADGGYCGDYATWRIENGTLIIAGNGAMYEATPGWSEYKKQINSVIINDGITNIPDSAFENARNLKNVIIPDSVTSIGYDAFGDCSALTSVMFGENSQLTRIGNYAFSDCSSLTSITIPESAEYIGFSAFSGCSSLTSITIPDGVTSIMSATFSGCSSLTSVTIPDSVKTLDREVFSGCSSLESVTIGDGVKTISDKAFYNCTKLKTVYIGSSVKSVGEMAFAACTNITDVYYNGTQEQWNAITVEVSNARLTDAAIHFKSE